MGQWVKWVNKKILEVSYDILCLGVMGHVGAQMISQNLSFTTKGGHLLPNSF